MNKKNNAMIALAWCLALWTLAGPQTAAGQPRPELRQDTGDAHFSGMTRDGKIAIRISFEDARRIRPGSAVRGEVAFDPARLERAQEPLRLAGRVRERTRGSLALSLRGRGGRGEAQLDLHSLDLNSGAFSATMTYGGSVLDLIGAGIIDLGATGGGQQLPHIDHVDPSPANPADVISINGSGFGSSPSNCWVVYENQPVIDFPPALYWSDTEIRAALHQSDHGTHALKVQCADGTESRPYMLTVEPVCPPGERFEKEVFVGRDTAAYAIWRTHDCDFVVVGATGEGDGGAPRPFFLRMTADGNFESDAGFASKAVIYELSGELRDVRPLDERGNLIMVGTAFNADAGDSSDVLVIATDSEGKPLPGWPRTYSGDGGDGGHAVETGNSVEIHVAGWTDADRPERRRDAWLLRIDLEGDVKHKMAFGGEHDDEARDLRRRPEGGFAVAGRTVAATAGTSPQSVGWGVWFDQDFAPIAQHELTGEEATTANAVLPLASGTPGIAIGGALLPADGQDPHDLWGLLGSAVAISTAEEIAFSEDVLKTYPRRPLQEAHDIDASEDGGYLLAGWNDQVARVVRAKCDGEAYPLVRESAGDKKTRAFHDLEVLRFSPYLAAATGYAAAGTSTKTEGSESRAALVARYDPIDIPVAVVDYFNAVQISTDEPAAATAQPSQAPMLIFLAAGDGDTLEARARIQWEVFDAEGEIRLIKELGPGPDIDEVVPASGSVDLSFEIAGDSGSGLGRTQYLLEVHADPPGGCRDLVIRRRINIAGRIDPDTDALERIQSFVVGEYGARTLDTIAIPDGTIDVVSVPGPLGFDIPVPVPGFVTVPTGTATASNGIKLAQAHPVTHNGTVPPSNACINRLGEPWAQANNTAFWGDAASAIGKVRLEVVDYRTPDVMLYNPAGSLIGVIYGGFFAGEPPGGMPIPKTEWYGHWGGWHSGDGLMTVYTDNTDLPDLSPAGVLPPDTDNCGYCVRPPLFIYHPALWDLHVWINPNGPPTLSILLAEEDDPCPACPDGVLCGGDVGREIDGQAWPDMDVLLNPFFRVDFENGWNEDLGRYEPIAIDANDVPIFE